MITSSFFKPDFDLKTVGPVLPPKIAWALIPLVWNFAIIEDVLRPDFAAIAEEVGVDEYHAGCAQRIRSLVAETLAGNHIVVQDEAELTRLCDTTANLVVVLRWLSAVIRSGEVTLAAATAYPLFETFRDYLTNTQANVVKRKEVAAALGIRDEMDLPEPKHSQYKLSIVAAPTKYPTPPVVYEALQPVILQFAVFDDFAGPLCRELDPDRYVAAVTERVRPFVLQAFQRTGVASSPPLIAAVCEATGSEVFVVRRLNEARMGREITLRDLKEIELYDRYRKYFQRNDPFLERIFAASKQAGIPPLRRGPEGWECRRRQPGDTAGQPPAQ